MSGVRYVSTRSRGEPVGLSEALRRGLAPDGGLYVPSRLPEAITPGMPGADSFQELAHTVLSRWIGSQIQYADLQDIVAEALNFEVPLVKL
ncbi:MAG: threonine synthase, partial [Rhodothermales bacterium]|nr:threonine synthase [Rhodothermales bacterium]